MSRLLNPMSPMDNRISPKQEILLLQNQTQQIANIANEIENDEYCNEHDHDAERPDTSEESDWDAATLRTELIDRENWNCARHR